MNAVYYPELDETLYREVLENGLTIAVLPRKDFTKKLCYFVTDYGSIHTNFTFGGEEHHVSAGIAHYLEHKLFDMPDGRDISGEFAAMGANLNAFTSFDVTAYYFNCSKYFEECLGLLLEFVSTPYFTAESVEKERGIIDQEIGMNADTPESEVFENLTREMYAAHPIRVPILGTSESIREITPEMLTLVHRAFYAPGNMMLCVVGDVDPEAVAATARRVLGTEPREVGQKALLPEEPMVSVSPEVIREMDVSVPMFHLAFKCEYFGQGETSIRQEMVAELAADLLFSDSSHLYPKLYEEGIIDSSFGGGFDALDGCSMLICSGDCADPHAVREAVLEEVARIAAEGISDEEFLRMKRSILGRRIRGLDSFDSTCYRICAYHLSGFDYFRFPEIYRTIEKQELIDFLTRVVTRERSCLSVIKPLEKEENVQ